METLTNAHVHFTVLNYAISKYLGSYKDDPVDLSMESATEILSRLKFLGHIQKNDKILVKHLSIQPDGWITRFVRSFISPDNRINTLKFVRDVINRTFEILQQNLEKEEKLNSHPDDRFVCKNIVKDLIAAQQGLLNLKETYSDDLKFCCDLDVFIESIISKLADMKRSYSDLFTGSPYLPSIVPSPNTRGTQPPPSPPSLHLPSPNRSPSLTEVKTNSPVVKKKDKKKGGGAVEYKDEED